MKERKYIYYLTLSLISMCFICTTSCNNEDDGSNVLPLISVEGVSEVEGNSGSKTVAFKIRSNEAAKEAITFDYETQDAAAIAGEDYEAKSGMGRIETGEKETFIDILILGDEEVERDEAFKLVISNAVNANIALNTGTGNIINDEPLTGDEGYSTPISYPDYTLVWSDEFDGTDLNAADWNYETGNSGWGNNELQNYLAGPSNAYINNGKLIIEAKKENSNGSNYTSARITTQSKQSFTYGRIDIRAKLPKGQGLWPALWMLGESFSTVGWPACGEIDIMEIVGHEPSVLHGTTHWDNSGSYSSFGGSTDISPYEFDEEFHVFTIIWDAQAIFWYLDDDLYHSINISPSGLNEFKEPFFFIFNVAVGGNWPGSPNASTVFPQIMIVDYIRMFQ